jgi:hypothetical protein
MKFFFGGGEFFFDTFLHRSYNIGMGLNSSDIKTAYGERFSAMDINENDVVHTAMAACRNFHKPNVRIDFETAILQGIQKAFTDYDPSKQSKFTTYLYTCMYGRLLNHLKSEIRQVKRANKAKYFHSEYPSIYDKLEMDDMYDVLGRILWEQHRPDLFMMLPLIRLGYSNYDIGRFMMKDEKQIRRFWKKLIDIAQGIFNKENKDDRQKRKLNVHNQRDRSR